MRKREEQKNTQREAIENASEPHRLMVERSKLTPDWPERLVASTSAGVCAVVLCVSSGWGAAKSKTRGSVNLWGGCLAAAAVTIAANATEGVL